MPTLLAETADNQYETAGSGWGGGARVSGGEAGRPPSLPLGLGGSSPPPSRSGRTSWLQAANLGPRQPLQAALPLKTSLNFSSNLLPVCSSLDC